jgi:hypothetical protein
MITLDPINLKDFLDVFVIPILLALLAIGWPEFRRFWQGRSMKKLILRELSEIAPHPTEAKLAGWWEHQKKQFVHRKIFDKGENHIDLLLSLDPDMVYFVTVLWQSLRDRDWNQWLYALEELSRRYDDQIKPPDRRGKISNAITTWKELHKKYPAEAGNIRQ